LFLRKTREIFIGFFVGVSIRPPMDRNQTTKALFAPFEDLIAARLRSLQNSALLIAAASHKREILSRNFSRCDRASINRCGWRAERRDTVSVSERGKNDAGGSRVAELTAEFRGRSD